MKTVTDPYASEFSSFLSPSDRAFGSPLLDKIGEDLRHVYGGLADADVPRRLLELAETIDARRFDVRRDD